MRDARLSLHTGLTRPDYRCYGAGCVDTVYRTGSLRSPSLRREARHIPPHNGPCACQPPACRQKLRRLRVAWGPLPNRPATHGFAAGRPYSRWSSDLTRSGWPCGRLRARHAAVARPPRGRPRALYLAEPLKRFSDRLLRVAGQFAHPRSKPIAMENGVSVAGPLILKP